MQALYAIGTQFLSTGKQKYLCTVVDIYTTFNLKKEIVNIRYVATHLFCGQKVFDHNVVAVTIARNLVLPTIKPEAKTS